MKRAVYAGSFDPPTNGHMWMIAQGSSMFDELVVAIGTNTDKKSPLFTTEERAEMLRDLIANFPNVKLMTFPGVFQVSFAESIGASILLRGIRSVMDLEYERTIRHVNADIAPGILTVFLMPPRNLAEVSSSLVKGLVGPPDWERVVDAYVPKIVLQSLKTKR